MADPYIDQYETVAYGQFAVGQILAHVVGLDSDADSFVKIIAARLWTDTDSMWSALSQIGSLDGLTYSAAESAAIVDQCRSILRRAIAYAESRSNGGAIVYDILRGDAPSAILRRRPEKLIVALEQALEAIKKYQASLPEHEQWTQEITAAHAALADLNGSVRKARTNRRQVTPEIEVARNTWLRRYTATKLIIRGILEPLGKGDLMPEIFDDLADVHRAHGVRDDDPQLPPDSLSSG